MGLRCSVYFIPQCLCCSHLLAYSCSAEGTVIIWDVATLQVKRDISLNCDRLQSIQIHSGKLWCCK